MKKFSTAFRATRLLPLTASLLFALASSPAQSADDVAAGCTFRQDAPDQHKVVRGDTLWDISGRFLAHPWCWPRVWGLNRDQIRDPHWIYPGQVVVFDRAAGRLRLAGEPLPGSNLPEVKLTPQARIESLGNQAIPTIPAGAIEPFLTQPLIVDVGGFDAAPRVLATGEGRINAGRGDKIFVRGDLKGESQFQAFRPARPLKDPVTGEILGYEAAYLGVVKLDRAARSAEEAHRFIVTDSREEIAAGARLVPVPARTSMNYAPHTPASAIDGRVVSIYGGLGQAGRNNVVVVNRGAQEGVDPGTVLQLVQRGRVVRDPLAAPDRQLVKLPDESYGTLFVFRVFDKLSYGLVMQVKDAVRVNDSIRSPE